MTASSLLSFSKENRQLALDLIEWAHDNPLAGAAAPGKVLELRDLCTQAWGCDGVMWRKAFDLALDIWVANQEKKRGVF